MDLRKDKIRTQDEEGEDAPIDEIEDRVEAEMKAAVGRAKESVAQGLQDKELEEEGRTLKEEAERKLKPNDPKE